MKPALSIRQPWAAAIVLGSKRIENRTWRTHYRGPIYIHASKGMTHKEWEEAMAFIKRADPTTWETLNAMGEEGVRRLTGGVIGEARIVMVQSEWDSPWFTGPQGWHLTQVRAVEFRRCKGSLGLFRPEFEEEATTV